ncbi:MAG: hypothetical protein OEV28_14340 [Nitrospirota bacterium]|nr:hypothetical protein [Nitrospirota bacterium]
MIKIVNANAPQMTVHTPTMGSKVAMPGHAVNLYLDGTVYLDGLITLKGVKYYSDAPVKIVKEDI